MSWIVGSILDAVQDLGIDQDTLSVFSSDHGPHREIGYEGGSPGVFDGLSSLIILVFSVKFIISKSFYRSLTSLTCRCDLIFIELKCKTSDIF